MELLTNKSTSVPIKVWTDPLSIEWVAQQQLRNISTLPFVFKHIAVMPDVHYGKGATVGSVIACKGALIPAAVGVDVGCGMAAVKTGFKSTALPESLSDLRTRIELIVPVGQNSHPEPVPMSSTWPGFKLFESSIPEDLHDLSRRAKCQIGTLGGGNHFIEVCLDTEDNVWVMLHSGSRNIGKTVAEYFINEAKELLTYEELTKISDPDLAYLKEGSKAFNDYWKALKWLQDYAMHNRVTMLYSVLRCIGRALTKDINYFQKNPPLLLINCHHNYAEKENHFGEEVIVTRKGAVRARDNDYGIIPGSMGTKSYIVKGKGNPESFFSCSHGAGRLLSRSKAKEKFSVRDIEEQTLGVECKKDASVLDEIPGAYKDIDNVMENQSDLVEVIATLKQVLCVKG